MNQISLDINKSGQIINEPVVLRVGDKDQTITVNLLKDGQPYTNFSTATFFANKPSGSIVANDPANISSGTITYTVPQALVNEFGKITNAYFLIDGKTSTESFVIAVLQGVKISDDLNDYIPGMDQLNVIYDKWKAKLQTITDELAGVDAPKEVKNVIDNELKNYTDQINELQRRITAAETQLDALKIPKIGGRNLIIRSGEIPDTIIGTDGSTQAFIGFSLMSNYINVTPGEYLTFQLWGEYGKNGQSPDNNIRLAYYDNSNKLVSRQALWSYPTTLSVPDGAVKMQISYPTLMQAKVEAGNIPTDWTPAPEDKANVSDTNDLQNKYTALQTQADKSAVGTNLIVQSDLKNGYIKAADGNVAVSDDDFHSDNYIATNGETVFTFSSPDYTFKGSGNDILAMYDSNKNHLGCQSITSATQTLSKSNAAYIRFSINFVVEGGISGKLSDWLDNHRYKLEKGSVATDYSLNPSDIATNDSVQTAITSALGKVDVGKTITATDDTGKTVNLKITGIS